MSTLFQIYGVLGEKGHGKDTFSTFVQKHNPEFTILHFADDLKKMAGEIFGLTEYQMHDPTGKEELLPVEIMMDDYLDKMRSVTDLPIKPKNIMANSPRQILQYFGTDYVRKVKDSFWVDRVLDKIRAIGGQVLVPDTRYQNEVDAIRAIGGQVIKILRPGKAADVNSNHSSETELRKIKVDYTFSFQEGGLARMSAAALVVASNTLVLDGAGFDPIKSLEGVVEVLNMNLSVWEKEFGYGANIVPRYREDGSKYFVAENIEPLPTTKPTAKQVKHAGEVIDEALQEVLKNEGIDAAAAPGFPEPEKS